MNASARPLVIGLGNDLRRDDGVGRRVARALKQPPQVAAEVVELDGDIVELIDLWADRVLVIVVDAVRSGLAAGTVVRFEFGVGPPPPSFGTASTHGLSLAEACALAEELGRLPRRLVVYGVEAASVELGTGLSPAVALATETLTARIRQELGEFLPQAKGTGRHA